jgi:hypothetical protein
MKPEWGKRRNCLSCNGSFFDLGKNPIECPKCHKTFKPEQFKVKKKSALNNILEDTLIAFPKNKKKKTDHFDDVGIGLDDGHTEQMDEFLNADQEEYLETIKRQGISA